MKRILCIFTLLALACSATVYAESKKDTKESQTNFSEEQVNNISKSILKENSVIAQELKTLLNEKVEELEENSTSPQNPAFKQTRLKTFFDNDKYGVKKYAETSNALLNAYREKCDSNQTVTTDEINWDVEKTHSSSPVSVWLYDSVQNASYWLFFNEYDFSLECPNGGVYIAHKLCFTTAKYDRKNIEKIYEYVNCDLYRANINRN